MIQADFYTSHAQRCRALAKQARSQCAKDLFIELARRWDELTADKEFLKRLPPRRI